MIEITYINHSTCLIQFDNIYILTDPIWSNWLGIPIFGVRRIAEPGIRIEELQKIDLVLISHNHFDHMDLPTLKYLQNKFSPIFVTGIGNAELLEKNGLKRIIELNWWEKTSFHTFNVHFVPAQHWSGRMPWDVDTTLWGGFVIDNQNSQVYFAGDTAYNEDYLKTIRNKFSNIKASLLPISPSEPRKIFKVQHMNPDDAVRAHKALNSNLSVGIHTGTFNLGLGKNENSENKLKEAIKTNNINNDEFIIMNSGETRQI